MLRVSNKEELYIAFDVYGAGKKTEKPIFRVAVCSFNDEMPSSKLLSDFVVENAGVPVKILVSDSEGGVLPFEMDVRPSLNHMNTR